MPLSFKCGMDLLIDEAFARKNERDIALLIEEDLACSKGTFMRHPTYIYSEFWNKVRSCRIGRFMLHRADHRCHKAFAVLNRSVIDHSNYAGHNFMRKISVNKRMSDGRRRFSQCYL